MQVVLGRRGAARRGFLSGARQANFISSCDFRSLSSDSLGEVIAVRAQFFLVDAGKNSGEAFQG